METRRAYRYAIDLRGRYVLIRFGSGMPHLASEDDVFDGYHIPKGAIVMGNIWSVHRQLFWFYWYSWRACVCIIYRAILHDEEIYPEPFKFNPDRFLTQDGQLDPAIQDPFIAVFGFGRRFVYLSRIY